MLIKRYELCLSGRWNFKMLRFEEGNEERMGTTLPEGNLSEHQRTKNKRNRQMASSMGYPLA